MEKGGGKKNFALSNWQFSSTIDRKFRKPLSSYLGDALQRQRQTDLCHSEVSLVYIGGSRPAGAAKKDPDSNKSKQNQKA